MYRMIIVFLTLALTVLSGIFIYFNRSDWVSYSCNAHIKSHINSRDGKKVEINLNINVIVVSEESSEFLTVGSIKGLSEDYVIYRRIFISNKKSDFYGFTHTSIVREIRRPIDNTPDEVWQRYILPEAPGVAFYTQTKQIHNNALLIQGLTNPFFVCTRTER